MRHERIVSDPEIMLGKPVIRGTRITVEHVLRLLGDGLAPTRIVELYPHLTIEDGLAARSSSCCHARESGHP
jgi:uncharacterized protein (DUF433 family)